MRVGSRSPDRALARDRGAETLDFMVEDIYDRIMELTKGRGADACIDAVRYGSRPQREPGFPLGSNQSRNLHGHGSTVRAAPGNSLLPQLRNGLRRGRLWRLSGQKIPMGSAVNRGLTFRMAQTPVQRYLPKLLELIQHQKIDPSFVITHQASLEEGPALYKTFRDKQDGCIKVVLRPN
jgi:threonine dehydrogenase-like Zn-dependent dehydrogenase